MTVLLGFILYLENWNKDKNMSATGWKIFMREEVKERQTASLNEAIWLIERSKCD